MRAGRLFCIDTSSLIACARSFPKPERQLYADVWAGLGDMVSAGTLRAPERVRPEAERQSPTLLKPWFVGVPGLFVETSYLWAVARAVTSQFPRLVDDVAPSDKPDPWVVALAIFLRESRGLFDPMPVVVSQESRRNGSTISRIPEVCDELGIEHVDLPGMLELEGFSFQRTGPGD